MYCQREYKRGQPSENCLAVDLLKHNYIIPYHPAISFLGMYPTEMHTYAHQMTCMFIETLFIITPKCKQLKYPPTIGWIN